MTKAVNAKTWNLPVVGGRRYSNGPPASQWADVIVTDIANLPANLMIPGQTVGLQVGTTFTGLAQQLTPGNGATMDILAPGANGSYNGLERGVRIFPPTALVGENAQYAGWGGTSNLWNSASNNIAQANFRVYRFYGPRYYNCAPSAKCWGFLNTTVLGSGGDSNNRVGTYDIFDPEYSQYRYPFMIVGGVGAYYNPIIPGGYWVDSGPDSQKLCQVGGTSNHALNPPRTNGEWICFEQMVDLRRNRGNPDGITRLKMTWRDGSSRILEYPLNWDGGWNFATQYCFGFEGMGFYWNTAGVFNVDNYLIDTMPTWAVNMAQDDWIDPNPDFFS